MQQNDAAAAYKQAAIENAPPVKIVRMLFLGVLRFLDRAIASDPKGPDSEFTELIGRADAIVCELRLALDSTHDEGLVEQLESLYLFCEMRLAEALSQRAIAPVVEARQVLQTLSEAWEEIEVSSREPV